MDRDQDRTVERDTITYDPACTSLDAYIRGEISLDWEARAGEAIGLEWAQTDATERELVAICQLVRSDAYMDVEPEDGNALGEVLLPIVAPDRDPAQFWQAWCGYQRPPYFFVRGFFSGIAQAIARGVLAGPHQAARPAKSYSRPFQSPPRVS